MKDIRYCVTGKRYHSWNGLANCTKCGVERAKVDDLTRSIKLSKAKSRPRRHKFPPLPPHTTAFFANYKEPLKKVEKGFGYYGVIATDEDNDRVQCHLCGWFFQNLGIHLNREHSITGDKYKEKFHLARGTALVGESLRIKRVEAARRSIEAQKERMGEDYLKQMKEGYKEYAKKNPHNHGIGWSLEKRNKMGMCPDQLIEKIQDLAKLKGKTPSFKDFKIYYDWRYEKSIVKVFGTWNNAVQMAGLKANKRKVAFTQSELKSLMRDFYKKYKRSPSWSDMNRGLLPSTDAYRRHWNTLNEARAAAGVPIIMSVGKGYREIDPQTGKIISNTFSYKFRTNS